MTRLQIFHNTAFTVKYHASSEVSILTGAGQTYVNHRDILVILHGPVELSDTGDVYERTSTITVERTNGVRRWSIRLGTPVDDNYFHEYDVPETDIPEAVVQTVNLFIQKFEKGA